MQSWCHPPNHRDFFGDSSLKFRIQVRGLPSGLHSLVSWETFLFQYENKPHYFAPCTWMFPISKLFSLVHQERYQCFTAIDLPWSGGKTVVQIVLKRLFSPYSANWTSHVGSLCLTGKRQTALGCHSSLSLTFFLGRAWLCPLFHTSS